MGFCGPPLADTAVPTPVPSPHLAQGQPASTAWWAGWAGGGGRECKAQTTCKERPSRGSAEAPVLTVSLPDFALRPALLLPCCSDFCHRAILKTIPRKPPAGTSPSQSLFPRETAPSPLRPDLQGGWGPRSCVQAHRRAWLFALGGPSNLE